MSKKIAAKRYRDAYKEKYPERAKEQFRRNHLRGHYGITLEQYEKMLAAQDGACAACRETQEDKNLAVDHDHNCCPGRKSCGKCIRALLCDSCNKVLGLVNDDKYRLLMLVGYLSRPRLDI